MDFQIVKFHGFYKIILRKAGFFVTLKIGNIFVKPDWLAQVELTADFVQGMKNLVGAGIKASVIDTSVLEHVVVLEDFCPKPKHSLSCLSNSIQTILW